MSIATKIKTGSIWTPKKDNSEVFYAPLWRPDMVAKGGYIKNGTGALTAANPINLAVGANTIDVATAGTFIVGMPEGGTVATGTMTVTNSVVTIPAGVATSIATTGAVGNITVTSSNIIKSKDKSNLAMTVTGATWGYQGRSFDGTDDKIVIPNNAVIDISGVVTVEVWVKLSSSLAANADIVSKINTTTYLGCYMIVWNNDTSQWSFFTGNANSWDNAGLVSGSKGVWAYITGVYNGTNTKIYLNGVFGANAVASHTPVADGRDLYLGERETGTSDLNGVIGEARIYNRALTAGEIQQNYLVTKWRYV